MISSYACPADNIKRKLYKRQLVQTYRKLTRTSCVTDGPYTLSTGTGQFRLLRREVVLFWFIHKCVCAREHCCLCYTYVYTCIKCK